MSYSSARCSTATGVAAVEWFDRLLPAAGDEFLRSTLGATTRRRRAARRPIRLDGARRARHAALARAALATSARETHRWRSSCRSTAAPRSPTVERIRHVARARRRRVAGRAATDVVVVVSRDGRRDQPAARRWRRAARGQLPTSARATSLVATGEQVTAALAGARAAATLGVPARSFLGHQIRIETDSAFGRARIRRIDAERAARDARARATVAVVAGFQGVDEDGNITTLGRGGSDTSAVALAAALKADVCEIYTDVDGVYTSDPRICPQARKLERISYDEMLELASLGAKVLQIRSVEFAKRYGVPRPRALVASTTTRAPGSSRRIRAWKRCSVAGVAYDRDQAKITRARRAGPPGRRGAHLRPDRRRQHRRRHDHPERQRRRHHRPHLHRAAQRLRQGAATWSRASRARDRRQGVARRRRRRQGVDRRRRHAHATPASRRACSRCWRGEGINIQMISTSEIKISVVIDAKYAELAVRVAARRLHQRSAD